VNTDTIETILASVDDIRRAANDFADLIDRCERLLGASDLKELRRGHGLLTDAATTIAAEADGLLGELEDAQAGEGEAA
jgi:hypothetical protein